MSVVLGVDIGGSHITTALVDLNTRSVVAGSRKRKLVNAQAGAQELIKDWCTVIGEASKGQAVPSLRIGIAMPGPFDYEDGVSLIKEQDKFKSLYQLNVKSLLARHLDLDKDCIRFINDAACFLQGEVFCGAAKGLERVLGLTLGTGLGSAFSVNGIADDAALWKSKFKGGIAEDYLSARWFVKRYQELSGICVSGVKEMLDGPALYVAQVFEEFGENMSLFLVPNIKAFHAEAVVFGGNISNASMYFLPALQEKMRKNQLNVALYPAKLHEDAALIGAASCWKEIDNRVKLERV